MEVVKRLAQFFCRKQAWPQSMDDRRMQQLEQQQIEAEANAAAAGQNTSDSKGMQQEDALPDLVEDDTGLKEKRQGWYMVKHKRGNPRKGELWAMRSSLASGQGTATDGPNKS